MRYMQLVFYLYSFKCWFFMGSMIWKNTIYNGSMDPLGYNYFPTKIQKINQPSLYNLTSSTSSYFWISRKPSRLFVHKNNYPLRCNPTKNGGNIFYSHFPLLMSIDLICRKMIHRFGESKAMVCVIKCVSAHVTLVFLFLKPIMVCTLSVVKNS